MSTYLRRVLDDTMTHKGHSFICAVIVEGAVQRDAGSKRGEVRREGPLLYGGLTGEASPLLSLGTIYSSYEPLSLSLPSRTAFSAGL